MPDLPDDPAAIFEVAEEDVLTPAALTLAYCRQHGHRLVSLLVAEDLPQDLEGLENVAPDAEVDAVILGDLGDGFTAEVLNGAFRRLLEGAPLIAPAAQPILARRGRPGPGCRRLGGGLGVRRRGRW